MLGDPASFLKYKFASQSKPVPLSRTQPQSVVSGEAVEAVSTGSRGQVPVPAMSPFTQTFT
jgi:hypothetical protein